MIFELKDRYKGLRKWNMIAKALTGINNQPVTEFLRHLEDVTLGKQVGV
jgi:hypothetical protein